MRIFISLLLILFAFLLLKFRFQIIEIFGPFSWAERYLGSTELFLFLLAILSFILSLMYMTGTLDTFFLETFGRIF